VIGAFNRMIVLIDLGAEYTLTEIRLWYKHDSTTGLHSRSITYYNGSMTASPTGDVAFNVASLTSWREWVLSPPTYSVIAAVRYIEIVISGNTGGLGYLDDLSVNPVADPGDPNLNQCPGCFVSSIEEGRVYTSGAISSGADTDGFESDDNGATMSQLTVPDIYPDENLCGDIGVLAAGNFDAETILYHGAIVSGARKTIKVLYLGSSTSDVSPEYGGETFGPWKSRGQLEPHSQDGNIMLLVGTNADKTLVGMWVSTDGGETMTQRIEPVVEGSGRVERAFWVGRGTLQIILLGTSGVIGFSPDAGATLENKMGNIGDLTGIGEIVGFVEKYP
jgi:hypothetical protein